MSARLLIATALVGAAVCTPFVSAQQSRRSLSWRDNGGGFDNSHYVNSTQITKSNVAQLEVAWSYPVGDNSGAVFNPIVVDNLMYVLGRGNSLVALDATTGATIWIHAGLQQISRRGVNYWESKDRKERRLIFQMKHTLQAIDALTGKSIQTFGTDGFVDLRQGLRRAPNGIYRVQSNNPGKIFENLLILGSAPGEGYMSPPGDLRAYDVRTGKLVWQFHTVPHPGEHGYETWPKEAWHYVGGVNTWGEISIDERRGIAYFPTGSATYDFYGADRAGMNLFANCLLALDVRTGKLLWYQQLVHHDLWDWDLVAAPQLVTLRRNGRTIDAVAQATKHGYLYVFDRATGHPVFPITEQPVSASEVPSESAYPTQPVPSLPPFARQKFSLDDLNPYLSDEQRALWTEVLKGALNKGLYTPPSLRDTVSMPGNRGGANWGTTSANPGKGLMYVMSVDAPAILKLDVTLPALGTVGGQAGRPASPGEGVYRQRCQACHGANREGTGAAPTLTNVIERLGPESVSEVIENGRGQMPGIGLPDADTAALLGYLANPTGAALPSGANRLIGATTSPPPPGPIVATGGAPAAQAFVNTMPAAVPPEYGSHGGPAYPEGLNTPTVRYYSGWNVMRRIISPPWSTLTAYDLNKGTIKWQIPIGEEPSMVARGVRNTGLQQEQRAVIVTPTGLLFTSTSDGYFRALDAETGEQLWSTKMPAKGGALPAMYEVDGRAFIVVPTGTGGFGFGGGVGPSDAAPPGEGRPGADAADGEPPPAPAYIAFALPRGGSRLSQPR